MNCAVQYRQVRAGAGTLSRHEVEPWCVARGAAAKGTRGDALSAGLRALSDSPWLQGLGDAEKGDLFRSAELRMVNKGAFLFRQGDEAARVIILIKGRIKLVRTASDGRDLILCFIGPGHPFGLVASMLGRPQRISAQAVEPSTMLAWTSAELLHRMLGLPQLVINLARIIAERLEATRDRLQDLSTERVEQRVARAVMRLGASLARPVGDDEAIELLVSQQDLAELADTTPYSISRILSHWKRLGVASVGRRRVLIQHPQTLDLYAQRIARPAQQTASVLPRAAGKGRVAETIAGSPSIVLCTRATTQPQFCGTK